MHASAVYTVHAPRWTPSLQRHGPPIRRRRPEKVTGPIRRRRHRAFRAAPTRHAPRNVLPKPTQLAEFRSRMLLHHGKAAKGSENDVRLTNQEMALLLCTSAAVAAAT